MLATLLLKMVTLANHRLHLLKLTLPYKLVVQKLIEQRLIDVEKVKARAKLQETEHKLSGVLYERGVNDKSFKAKDFVAEMTSMNVADRQSYIIIQEPFERFIE